MCECITGDGWRWSRQRTERQKSPAFPEEHLPTGCQPNLRGSTRPWRRQMVRHLGHLVEKTYDAHSVRTATHISTVRWNQHLNPGRRLAEETERVTPEEAIRTQASTAPFCRAPCDQDSSTVLVLNVSVGKYTMSATVHIHLPPWAQDDGPTRNSGTFLLGKKTQNSRGLTPTLKYARLKLPREVSKMEPTKEVREEQK